MKAAPLKQRRAIRGPLANVPEIACGSKEFDPPFPFPPGASRGGAGSPHAGEHAARQQKALARIDAAGSPHKRGCRPLVNPPRATRSDIRSDCELPRIGLTANMKEKRLHKILDNTVRDDNPKSPAPSLQPRVPSPEQSSPSPPSPTPKMPSPHDSNSAWPDTPDGPSAPRSTPPPAPPAACPASTPAPRTCAAGTPRLHSAAPSSGWFPQSASPRPY